MKTKKKIQSFVIVLFIVVVSACSSATQASNPVQTLPTEEPVTRSRAVEEVSIYSLLLDTDPANYLSNASVLVVGDATFPAGTRYDADLSDLSVFVDQETVLDFKSINQVARSMPTSLRTAKPYALAKNEELLTLPGNGDWPEFDLKFPHTDVVTYFSGIGFNKDLSQALVYMQHYCGGECEIGNLYFLIRVEEEWKLERIIELWVS